MVLTDSEFNILNILRVVKQAGDKELNLSISEKYDTDILAREFTKLDTQKALDEILSLSTQVIRKSFNTISSSFINLILDFGPQLTNHVLVECSINPNSKLSELDNGKIFSLFLGQNIPQALLNALKMGEEIIDNIRNKPSKVFI